MILTRRISFVLFILIIVSSLMFNIYYARLKKNPAHNIFDLGGIYFDLALISDQENAGKIENFMKVYTIDTYTSMIESKNNPIAHFYSFCAILNRWPDEVGPYLEKLLVDSNQLNVIVSQDKVLPDKSLGYIVLYLLSGVNTSITGNQNQSFYLDNGQTLYEALSSNNALTDSEYRILLLNTINTYNPGLAVKIVDELVSETTPSKLTNGQKTDISYLLLTYSGEYRPDLLKDFLREDDETILMNTLKSIDTKDEDILKLLSKLFNKDINKEIKKEALTKYCMIRKEESFTRIKRFMKKEDDDDLILTCLYLIGIYSDDSNYDFLKKYLSSNYSEKVNLGALKAIISTTYQAQPTNVIKTINYILRRGKLNLATYAIKFMIDNSVRGNSATVLYRLRQMENQEIKELSLEYIENFSLKTGYSILVQLADDEDEKISSKANELLNTIDFTIKPNEASAENDRTDDADSSDNS